MSKMKSYIVLIASIITVFGFSIGYHNELVKQSVREDINSDDLVSQYSINDKEENKVNDEQDSISDETVETFNENEINNNTEESNSKETNIEEKNTPTDENKVEVTSQSYSNLSNQKCAWGFVRKGEGVTPEFYGPYTKPLDNNNGIYVGNKNEKVIYLTFDEGYENGYTSSILDTLKEKDVTATFFVTMPYVKQNPDLVKRMIDEGHIVGNHTVNHPSMPEITNNEKLAKEVMDLHDYILENFNYKMSYLRPPKGEYSERTVKLCLDLGYRHVLWSFAYADWDANNQKGSDYAKKMIYGNIHNGCVMLLHAVSKDNATVLGDVIDELRNKGYEFCSLDDFEY